MQSIFFRYKRLIQALLIILFTFMSSSCSLFKEPLSEDKFDLGLTENVKIKFVTTTNVNPNEEGVPSPIRIVIYQLVHAEKFNYADFFTLSNGTDPKLGAEVKKYYDTILMPGDQKTLNVNIEKETRALGIVAEYRDIDEANWKRIYILPERPRRNWYWKFLPHSSVYLERIEVNLGRSAILLKKMDS